MTKICLRLQVRGRVQGVWFRKFTQEQAQSSGVQGWVRNCADGSVEAMLCGEERAVRHVEAWLNRGPDLANVVDVAVQELAYQAFDGFEIWEDAG